MAETCSLPHKRKVLGSLLNDRMVSAWKEFLIRPNPVLSHYIHNKEIETQKCLRPYH